MPNNLDQDRGRQKYDDSTESDLSEVVVSESDEEYIEQRKRRAVQMRVIDGNTLEEDNVLCVCGEIRDDEWVECTSASTCRNGSGGWYHLQCAGLQGNTIGVIVSLKWTCSLCVGISRASPDHTTRVRTTRDTHRIMPIKVPTEPIGGIEPTGWMTKWTNECIHHTTTVEHKQGYHRQCTSQYGEHDFLDNVHQLRAINDDAAMIWGWDTNQHTTIPLVAVFNGEYGVSSVENLTLHHCLREWMTGPDEFRPKPADPSGNRRARNLRPEWAIQQQHIFLGGVIMARGQSWRIPVPTVDSINLRGMPYLGYLQKYRDTGVCRRFGEIRYLLDPDQYREHREALASIPQPGKSYITEEDGASTHAINSQICVDCHIDTQDIGWVLQVSLGIYPENWLCFPTLGVRIPTRPGTIVAFYAGELEHYVTNHAEYYDLPDGQRVRSWRFVHTNHMASLILNGWKQRGSHWDAFKRIGDPDINFDQYVRALATSSTFSRPRVERRVDNAAAMDIDQDDPS